MCLYTGYVSGEVYSALGNLLMQVVPDDNSCLFSAVALIFEQSISKAQGLRKSAHLVFPQV